MIQCKRLQIDDKYLHIEVVDARIILAANNSLIVLSAKRGLSLLPQSLINHDTNENSQEENLSIDFE